MSRVVPSQVCAFIDEIPPYVVPGSPEVVSMNMLGSDSLSSVLDLVNQVPDELLTMDNTTYNSIIRCISDPSLACVNVQSCFARNPTASPTRQSSIAVRPYVYLDSDFD